MLTLVIRGEFALISTTGQDISPRGHKTKALLAMLAVSPDGARTRKWLRETLWSDRSDEQGATSLRQSLSELRRALSGSGPILKTDRSKVMLNLDAIKLAPGEGRLLDGLNVRDPAFLEWRKNLSRAMSGGLALDGQWPGTGPASETTRFHPPFSVRHDTQTADTSAISLRNRNASPTVAVASLFAVSNSHDSEQSTIIRSLIRQVSNHLDSWRRYSVIAPSMAENTLRQVGGGNTGLRQLRLALACEYVVDVTVLPRGNGYEVHADLFDADATLRWSASFPWLNDEADEETMQVIAGNAGTVIDSVEQKVAHSQPDDTNLRNLTFRGRYHMLRMNRHDCEIATALYEKAAQIEPDNLALRINVAFGIFARAWASRGPLEALRDVRERARAITTLDETFPQAFYLLGNCESLLRRRDEARFGLMRSLRLAPSIPLAQAQHGSNLLAEGRFEEAIEALRKSLRLGESDRRRFFILGEMAMALHLAGQQDEAIGMAERAVGLRENYWYAHMIRCAAHECLGNRDAARQSGEKVFETRPDIERADIDWLPFEDRSINQAFWILCEKYRH